MVATKPKPEPPAHGIIRQSQPRNTKKKSFLELPSELRNLIYREVLVIPTGKMIDLFAVTKISREDYDIKVLRIGHRSKPCLLRVSRQVYDETKTIYYEENLFCLTEAMLTPSAVTTFITAVPDISRIKKISLRRNYKIVDQKVEVRFTAFIQQTKIKGVLEPRVLIHRSDRVVFPGINTKKVGDLAEPCRCDVKKLAWDCNSGKNTNGKDLFDFVLAYVDTIKKKSIDVLVKTCEKCGTARRY